MTDFSLLIDGFFDVFSLREGERSIMNFTLLNYQQRLIHSFKANALKLCISPESSNVYIVIGLDAKLTKMLSKCRKISSEPRASSAASPLLLQPLVHPQNDFHVSLAVFLTSRQISFTPPPATASSSSSDSSSLSVFLGSMM